MQHLNLFQQAQDMPLFQVTKEAKHCTCKHETAIVSHSIRELGLTQMLCTWRCRQVFWMLQTGQVTKEISGEEATALIKAHNRISK